MPRFDTRRPGTAIHIAEQPRPPVAFAAAELQRYLQHITGSGLPVLECARLAGCNTLVVGASPAPAAGPPPLDAHGFAVVPENGRITLAGGSPRAALDAVYALLEQCGCRWSLHGSDDESGPRRALESVELQPMQGAASFAVRGYSSDIMTWHYTQPEYFNGRLADDRAFIDWMGKSGANAFFFIRHPFDTQLTVAELVPEFQRRGIDLEYGGHVMPLLLPRELFADHPEYFPESPEGQRTDYGNLCVSSAAALATASATAVQYVREYPDMSVLHLWGADLWRGGWCHCPACRSSSVQDQSLLACNAVARALAQAGVARPVCYLAYHDTIDPVVTVRPDDNVVVEFAPRERCYGHALNAPDCATNRRYAAALERYVDLFDGRARLFEYYGDAILFCGCAVPLTEVIAADLEYYRQCGIPGVTMLQFGAYSVWAHALNFLEFAARTRAGHASAAGRDVSCSAFGPHAGGARTQLAELEAVMRPVVTYGDIRRPPRAPAEAALLLPRIEAALPRIAAVGVKLEALGGEALVAQAALLRYTWMILDGVRQELVEAMAGRRLHGAGRYTEALRVIESVERRFKGLWGRVDLPIIHAFHDAAAAGQ